ncbi:hypothetical protein HWV62_10499 [Athelia sp. TMB]|nr:hypothetical protein HWV62_10499 [Athelia sp. TMB]
MPTVQDLILILQTLFSDDLDLRRAIYTLTAIISVFPLLRLHQNQLATQPRQSTETGWMTAIWAVLYNAFHPELADPDLWNGEGPGAPAVQRIYEHIGDVSNLLDTGNRAHLFTDPKPILITHHTTCVFCSSETSQIALHKRGKGWIIKLINTDFKICSAQLLIATCRDCGARYYPDRITYSSEGVRLQRLEWDTRYLRISKHRVWAVCELAIAQEKAIYHMHASFFNFSKWLDSTNGSPTLTVRQSQKLFTEHFARRLIPAHNAQHIFQCPADSSTNTLAQTVRQTIGTSASSRGE